VLPFLYNIDSLLHGLKLSAKQLYLEARFGIEMKRSKFLKDEFNACFVTTIAGIYV